MQKGDEDVDEVSARGAGAASHTGASGSDGVGYVRDEVYVDVRAGGPIQGGNT